jgi:Fe-S-cluster containining protein
MFFFREKIFFSCNQCGECCKDMDVPLSHIDIKRLIEANTGLDSEMFITLHPATKENLDSVLLYGEYHELFLTNKLSDNSCIFLKDNSCSIYEYRPNSCRTWPFSKNIKNKLFIDDVASKLVEISCDKDKFKDHKNTYKNIENSIKDAKEYREITYEWNICVSDSIEKQTLENFINFIQE